MTSPVTEKNVVCPKCEHQYIAFYRASMNQQLDNFSEAYIKKMSTAVCPKCKTPVQFDTLVVRDDGAWEMREGGVAGNQKKGRATKEATQQTGMAGTYLVAAKLTLAGCVATVTSRNARAVDILAYNPITRRSFAVQVKTNSITSSWETDFGVRGVQEIASPDLLYAFVQLKEDGSHQYFLVPSEEVKDRVNTAKPDWAWFSAETRDEWEARKALVLGEKDEG